MNFWVSSTSTLELVHDKESQGFCRVPVVSEEDWESTEIHVLYEEYKRAECVRLIYLIDIGHKITEKMVDVQGS